MLADQKSIVGQTAQLGVIYASPQSVYLIFTFLELFLKVSP